MRGQAAPETLCYAHLFQFLFFTDMAQLDLTDIRKSYGGVDVLRGIDLKVADGEFCAFVGPSGCGKSTLLRMIAGIDEPDSGTVAIASRDVTELEPADRGIAMVFQSYALYPHMTVAENMGFALKLARVPRERIAEKVKKAASILQLERLLERRPRDLSGGQRQRVAIGRAIVREPDIFLFDEPLSNLDAGLRVEMRIELAKLKQELRATMIYVTHDQVEAMTLADRIVVLNAGRIEQVGAPLELYHRPANRFVASFIGSPRMNFFEARVESLADGHATVEFLGGSRLSVPLTKPLAIGAPVTLGVRPEHLKPGVELDAALNAQVQVAEMLGDETYLHLLGGSDGRARTPLVVRTDSPIRYQRGDSMRIGIAANTCHLFDADGLAISRATSVDPQSRQGMQCAVIS